MATDTIQVLPNRATATLIVAAGSGPTLVTNMDLNNTVYLGDTDTIKVGDPTGIVPLGPNGSVTVDGNSDLFAVNGNSATVVIATLTGGLSNFLGLTQGGGTLVIPSIHSPNFGPGTGWSINKDGTATFNAVSIVGSAQSTNFVTGVSGWQILANGIAELNQATIRGNIAFSDGWLSNGDGTYTDQPGLFLYSGVPAAGNLIFSFANVGGHDKFSNTYLAGQNWYHNGGVLQFALNIATNGTLTYYTFTSQPNAVFTASNSTLGFVQSTLPVLGADSGITISDFLAINPTNVAGKLVTLFPDGNGRLNYVDAAGGQYISGKQVQRNGNNIAVTSTTFATVFTANVQPGNYRLKALILYNTGTTAAGNPAFAFGHGSSATVSLWTSRAWYISNTGTSFTNGQFSHVAGYPNDFTGPTMAAGATYVYEMEADVSVTAAGTIILSANTSVAADTYSVLSGSFMEVYPI